MSEILLESLRGVRIFRRGVREKGGSDEPRTTPLVTGLRRAEAVLYQAFAIDYFLQTMMEDVAKVHTLSPLLDKDLLTAEPLKISFEKASLDQCLVLYQL